jgi:hypothetical protein
MKQDAIVVVAARSLSLSCARPFCAAHVSLARSFGVRHLDYLRCGPRRVVDPPPVRLAAPRVHLGLRAGP